MDIIERAYENALRYAKYRQGDVIKRKGQYFTPPRIAVFMVELLEIPDKTTIRILDAGAGSGVLCAAAVCRLREAEEWTGKIELTCYENDPDILPVLRTTLCMLEDEAGFEIDIVLKEEDYVLAQRVADSAEPGGYDWILGNPPYMKLQGRSPHARSLPEVCRGAPNLYMLFIAAGIMGAADGAEMVYLVPRSWTSGAYFRQFREYVLSNTCIEAVHLFCDRKKVFMRQNVLQEVMIVKLKKALSHPARVRISHSQNGDDITNCQFFHAPYDVVAAGPEGYVFIPLSEDDIGIMYKINAFPCTLPDLGLSVRVGKLVKHRESQLLKGVNDKDDAPLIGPQHVRGALMMVSPSESVMNFVNKEKPGLLLENGDYLFIRRISSRDEPRRLNAGIYLGSMHPGYSHICTDNKVNYITCRDSMSQNLVYGLYVLFASSLYDRYYRMLCGTTQANATELNAMPVPGMEALLEMGERLIEAGCFTTDICDRILAAVCPS